MPAYQIWLIIAFVLVIIEICTVSFGSVCFAIGAGFAALANAVWDLGLTYQIIIFAVVSLLTFIFLRPVALRFLNKSSKEVKTNAEALVGRKAVVSERIDPSQRTGRVAVDGDDWKAVSENNEVIEKGASVEIVKLDSIILTVKPSSF